MKVFFYSYIEELKESAVFIYLLLFNKCKIIIILYLHIQYIY